MAEFKVPKKLAYLLDDSTNTENIAKLKDLISKYIKDNLPTGAKLDGRQGVPGLPELIKFKDGKGVKLSGVSRNYNKGKRVGFSYTDLEGANVREDMLTLMTDKSGAASVTRYGRVARKLPKGFEDHHRRFRTLYQPFYEGLSESDAKKLTQWFVEQHAPLGNVLENLEGVDTDLHRTMENSIHTWARENNIQVDIAKPGQKNFYMSEDGQTVAVKGGAANIEGVRGPDGKLKYIPDKRPPVVTAKSFGAATRATFPDISKLSLNERLVPASDFLKYVDEPLQDYTAKILHKQDIWEHGKGSDKVRSVEQIKANWANQEANAAARANILADYPEVSAADLDSPSPNLLKDSSNNILSKLKKLTAQGVSVKTLTSAGKAFAGPEDLLGEEVLGNVGDAERRIKEGENPWTVTKEEGLDIAGELKDQALLSGAVLAGAKLTGTGAALGSVFNPVTTVPLLTYGAYRGIDQYLERSGKKGLTRRQANFFHMYETKDPETGLGTGEYEKDPNIEKKKWDNLRTYFENRNN